MNNEFNYAAQFHRLFLHDPDVALVGHTSVMGVRSVPVTSEMIVSKLQKKLVDLKVIKPEDTVQMELSYFDHRYTAVTPEKFEEGGGMVLDIRAGGIYHTFKFNPRQEHDRDFVFWCLRRRLDADPMEIELNKMHNADRESMHESIVNLIVEYFTD
jgi:hypothetical protein